MRTRDEDGADCAVWQGRTALREEIDSLRGAVEEAKRKLELLVEVRRLIEENEGSSVLATLFCALLDQAEEIRREADDLTEMLCALEEDLSEACFMAGGGSL